ncbi:MAG: CpsD/CapB family tyrosine-protein kinase [Myxococcota bacterium]
MAQQQPPPHHRPPAVSGYPAAGAAPPQGYVSVVATHMDLPAGPFPLDIVSQPDSPLAASFRVLRHRLRRSGDPRTIAITSPGHREGKTTCAINLAMALAEHGREKVMLVEPNLRRPRLAEALGFAPPVCFAQQMAATVESRNMVWQVVATFFDNLHVLAVSPDNPEPGRLTAPNLRHAIETIRNGDYAYLVLDCPAALGSADVNIIEDVADGILLTSMAGTTTKRQLQLAAEHLAPAEIYGVVLMNQPSSKR